MSNLPNTDVKVIQGIRVSGFPIVYILPPVLASIVVIRNENFLFYCLAILLHIIFLLITPSFAQVVRFVGKLYVLNLVSLTLLCYSIPIVHFFSLSTVSGESLINISIVLGFVISGLIFWKYSDENIEKIGWRVQRD